MMDDDSATDFGSVAIRRPSRVDAILGFGAVFGSAADFGSAAVRRPSRVIAMLCFVAVFGSSNVFGRNATTVFITTPMFGPLCGLIRDRINEYKIDSK